MTDFGKAIRAQLYCSTSQVCTECPLKDNIPGCREYIDEQFRRWLEAKEKEPAVSVGI